MSKGPWHCALTLVPLLTLNRPQHFGYEHVLLIAHFVAVFKVVFLSDMDAMKMVRTMYCELLRPKLHSQGVDVTKIIDSAVCVKQLGQIWATSCAVLTVPLVSFGYFFLSCHSAIFGILNICPAEVGLFVVPLDPFNSPALHAPVRGPHC